MHWTTGRNTKEENFISPGRKRECADSGWGGGLLGWDKKAANNNN